METIPIPHSRYMRNNPIVGWCKSYNKFKWWCDHKDKETPTISQFTCFVFDWEHNNLDASSLSTKKQLMLLNHLLPSSTLHITIVINVYSKTLTNNFCRVLVIQPNPSSMKVNFLSCFSANMGYIIKIRCRCIR